MDEPNFNRKRLRLARKRRRLTAKALAQSVGVDPVTISRLEQGHNAPESETLRRIADALQYPVTFFCGDDLDELGQQSASFRSLSSMTARDRDAALAAGAIAFVLSDWVSGLYKLPEPDVPELGIVGDPELAARYCRQHWGLGDRPIGNTIQLLESKGIRVFSLAENTLSVDAYSCWRTDTPYVFLNTLKSTEHSRFDAAHELGHLVMHRHGAHAPAGRQVEDEANRFAAAFLMPESDVRVHASRVRALPDILRAKRRWGVSVAALTVRLNQLGMVSKWRYAELFRQIAREGYRKSEPDGLPAEASKVWPTVLSDLWRERRTLDRIAAELMLPLDELQSLLKNLVRVSDRAQQYASGKGVRETSLWVLE